MTTAQAPTNGTNGHRVSPPPCSLPHSQEENQSKDSPNNNESPTPATEAFPAHAYHVPPARYVPKAHSYRYDDTLDPPPDTSPLPERCQFMFSDGRQCTMGRSEIHPSLCPYHSEREDQLFGAPSAGGSVVGTGFDLPELYSACRDLTTAAGVNRALGQVFRLLAQRRISRQEAATFAKLGHLLLQSISAIHAERVASVPRADLAAPRPSVPTLAAAPPAEQAGPSPKGADTCTTPSTPQPPAKPGPSFRATIRSEESLSAPPNSEESLPQITRPSLDASSVVSQALSKPAAAKNSSGINTSPTSVCNSREINTYENTELKTVHNEHLRKKRGAV